MYLSEASCRLLRLDLDTRPPQPLLQQPPIQLQPKGPEPAPLQRKQPLAEEDSVGNVPVAASHGHASAEGRPDLAQLQVQQSQEPAVVLQELRGLVSALTASVAQAAKDAQQAQSGVLLHLFHHLGIMHASLSPTLSRA